MFIVKNYIYFHIVKLKFLILAIIITRMNFSKELINGKNIYINYQYSKYFFLITM